MEDVKSRREHIRKRAQLPIQVLSVTGLQNEPRDCKNARFVGLNLSSRGLGLETLYELISGEKLDLILTLEAKPISLSAVVRSVTTERRGQHLVYRAGLEFSKISEADQKAITNYTSNMGVIV